jgi:hypothetical protein
LRRIQPAGRVRPRRTDPPLTGRARSLANLRPFVKGQPKDLARFGDILIREFYKTVPVNLAGKTVNKTQGEIVALGDSQERQEERTLRATGRLVDVQRNGDFV